MNKTQKNLDILSGIPENLSLSDFEDYNKCEELKEIINYAFDINQLNDVMKYYGFTRDDFYNYIDELHKIANKNNIEKSEKSEKSGKPQESVSEKPKSESKTVDPKTMKINLDLHHLVDEYVNTVYAPKKLDYLNIEKVKPFYKEILNGAYTEFYEFAQWVLNK